MSRFKFWVTIILLLVALGLIGWNLSGSSEDSNDGIIVNDGQPSYQAKDSQTFVHEPSGELAYKLVASEVQNFAQEKITWFTEPVLTTYDPDSTPTWVVRAKKAKLTNDKMLYLYGDVQVESLTTDTQLQRILTESAVVNLTTQDISSEDEVTILGVGLKSVGMKMRGNMRNRSAELIEKVNTYYEIPNENKNP